VWNGEVWFGGNWPTAGIELLRTDGSAAGTQLAIDVNAGGGHSGPRNLTAVGNLLFFTATVANGTELFRTDGTAAGTQQFDLQPGNNSSFPERLVRLGNRVVFAATDAAHGQEAWSSDGTTAGTVLLGDVQPGSTSGFFDGFAVFGGRAWFSANVPGAGIELCCTDGTPGGTSLFVDLLPGTSGSRPNGFVAAGGLLFFRAYVNGLETGLWRTDGTVAGTHPVLDLPGSLSAEILDMVAGGNLLYFVADDRVHGRELWRSDGTTAGTRCVADLDAGFAHGVLAGTLVPIAGTGMVVFAGSDGQDGLQLWLSNGSSGGTLTLGRIGFGGGSGAASLRAPTVVGNRLFFAADDGVLGEELWMFDLAIGNGAFAQTYGASLCPGTGGQLPRIVANGLPRLGSTTFAIDLRDARPTALATLCLGLAPSSLTLDGCRILLAAPFQSLPFVATDAAGQARTAFPVPSSPTFQGLQLFAQYAVLDPAGALFDGIALSEGLWLRIGS
jgi:ELWxxDGT repeat protein